MLSQSRDAVVSGEAIPITETGVKFSGARMSEIKSSGLDQYGAEPFEQQQLETAGVEGVNSSAQGRF